MKNFAIFIMAVMLVSFLVGCGAQNVEMSPEQEAYQAEMQTRLDEMEQRIQALRQEAQQLDNEARPQLVQMADDLEIQQTSIRGQVEQLSFVNPEQWEDVKASIDVGVQELEAAYQQAEFLLEQNS
jgi:hypothetical protein